MFDPRGLSPASRAGSLRHGFLGLATVERLLRPFRAQDGCLHSLSRGVAPGYFISRFHREEFGFAHSTKNSTRRLSAQKRSSPAWTDTKATCPPRSVSNSST